VDRAVAIVVVADGAVEHVFAENAVESFLLRGGGSHRRRQDIHPGSDDGRARALELSVHFDHAGIAGLNWAELGVVADLGELAAYPVDQIDEALIRPHFLNYAVYGYAGHRDHLIATAAS